MEIIKIKEDLDWNRRERKADEELCELEVLKGVKKSSFLSLRNEPLAGRVENPLPRYFKVHMKIAKESECIKRARRDYENV